MANSVRPIRLSRLNGMLSFEQLEQRCCLAIDMQPIVNLNQDDLWQEVRQTTAIGDLIYFLATEKSSTTADLWRTDGTTQGTFKLSKLDRSAFETRQMTDVNGTLYFIGFDPIHGRELWKSDGTIAGTRMIRDITSGLGDSSLDNFVVNGGKFYFTANGQLHTSNGTLGGTVEIIDLLMGVSDGIKQLVSVNNSLYFTTQNSANTNFSDLYKSNGTSAGTVRVSGIASGRIDDLTNINGNLYFSNDNRELWRADPTTDLASMVVGASAGFSYPNELTDVNGTVYFSSNGSLWKSNSTTEGTVEVKSIGEDLFNLFNMQGVLYFAGGTRFFGDGIELWKSDGTLQGTVMVKDIDPGFDEGYGFSSDPSSFINWNGQLIFLTTKGIWTTDGSTGGTVPFESGGVHSMALRKNVGTQGQLFFSRSSPSSFDSGLWKRTSASSTSTAVKRPGVGEGDANPTLPVELNGQFYMGASDGTSGHELWKLDAQNRMTLVKDIYPGPSSSNVSNIVKFNGQIIFTATDPLLGRGLFASDGTATGTKFLAAIDQVLGSFVPVNDLLFFTAYNRSTGHELWKTNGSNTGTLLIKDIFPGKVYEPDVDFYPNSSSPSELTNFNGQLYFAATVEGERELWKSDGTVEGTVMAVDIYPGEYYDYPYTRIGSNPTGLVTFNGQLFFGARTENGSRLMRSDGTPQGTVGLSQSFHLVHSLTVHNSQLFFAAADPVVGVELWRSDGVNQPTLLKDINVGPASSLPGLLTAANGLLYFTADNGIHGRELWQSNGSAAGTLLIKDIRPGIDPTTNTVLGSNPKSFTPLNGTLFFTADDGRHGRELWRTNGAASGASLVNDLIPGVTGSSPDNLIVRGQELLFAANSNIGRELWRASSKASIISLPTAPVNFRENEAPILLAKDAKLTDADTPILAGGKLSVIFTSTYRSGDQLLIIPTSQINVSQSLVRRGGVVIGTLSRPADGSNLSIVFNANATVFSVELLLRAIGFQSTSDNPIANQRTVRFELSDGEAALARPQLVRFAVVPVNDAPVISGVANGLDYVRNTSGIHFASTATISDIDNRNFGGGQLVITMAGGEASKNRLTISNPIYTLDNNLNLLRRGVIIGSVNANGGIGLPLRITFNTLATVNVAQELLRSLKFSTENSHSLATRYLTISLKDGTGGIQSIAQSIFVR